MKSAANTSHSPFLKTPTSSRMLKKEGMEPDERAREQQTFSARRPTIKRSFDARSEEQSAYSLWKNWAVRRPSLATGYVLGAVEGRAKV